jgi:hypothetical protein
VQLRVIGVQRTAHIQAGSGPGRPQARRPEGTVIQPERFPPDFETATGHHPAAAAWSAADRRRRFVGLRDQYLERPGRPAHAALKGLYLSRLERVPDKDEAPWFKSASTGKYRQVPARASCGPRPGGLPPPGERARRRSRTTGGVRGFLRLLAFKVPPGGESLKAMVNQSYITDVIRLEESDPIASCWTSY